MVEWGLWNRVGLFERCSCRVKWTSRTVDEDASTVTRPRQDARSVRNVGTISGFRSADPISTPMLDKMPDMYVAAFVVSPLSVVYAY